MNCDLWFAICNLRLRFVICVCDLRLGVCNFRFAVRFAIWVYDLRFAVCDFRFVICGLRLTRLIITLKIPSYILQAVLMNNKDIGVLSNNIS